MTTHVLTNQWTLNYYHSAREQTEEETPNFEKGDYYAIRKLVSYLRNGFQMKLEASYNS